MIDLPQQRIGILTPPKCATHSLHAAFCAPPWNGVTLVGPTVADPRKYDRHVRQWPNELDGYRKLVVVRNPLDRLVSLYLHYARFEAAWGRGTYNFRDFCRHVVGPDRPAAFAAFKIYWWTLGKWLELAAWDAVLKVETLQDDLGREGLAIDNLPRENTSYRARPWQDFYTPELLELVRPWATPDCERFGYAWP